ncbi:hypothetical protein ACRAWD_07740 [Caulobacter segnis]
MTIGDLLDPGAVAAARRRYLASARPAFHGRRRRRPGSGRRCRCGLRGSGRS